MTARPPELDMALLCEEAGIDPGELNRLIDEPSQQVTCGSLSRLFPEVEQHLILGLISVGCRANAFERMSDRRSAVESQKWTVRAETLHSLVSRASIIVGAIPYFRKLMPSQDSFRLAATIPESLPALDRFYGAFENTALGMRRLIEEAETDVYIVAPFFNREGVEAIAPAVESALMRGINVTILARCLSEGEQNRRALENLIQISARTPGTLLLFESEQQDGSPLLHAKILARDDGEEVYVGSANLTGAGMERTLEVGVFLKGSQAQQVVQLVKQLMTFSEKKWP